MNVASGPFVIATVVLVIGGVSKLVHPVDTANALRAIGLPSASNLVRLGGATEGAIGLWAIVAGSRISAAFVALSYTAFTGFVIVVLVRGLPISSCGCLGKVDTPPTRAHVVVNLVFTLAALSLAVEPGERLADGLGDQPLSGIPFVVLAVIGVVATFYVLTTLARRSADPGSSDQPASSR